MIEFPDTMKKVIDKVREKELSIKGIQGYTKYINNKYNFTFEYPSNWILDEYDEYDGNGMILNVIGPLNVEKCLAVSLDMHFAPFVFDLPTHGGGTVEIKFSTLDEYVNFALKQIAWEIKIHSDVRTTFAGYEARSILISFNKRLPIRSIEAKNISIKKELIIFKKEVHFCEFMYEADTRDFTKYKQAYEHAKETFQFIGGYQKID
jgi:hypothetical protein